MVMLIILNILLILTLIFLLLYLFRNKKDNDENICVDNKCEVKSDEYKQNNLSNNFGEYYYLGKREEHKTLSFWPKIQSYLYWFSCGYGERPIYSIYSSLFIILIFTFLYLIVGIEIKDQLVQYSNFQTIRFLSLEKFARDLLESFSLSVSAFTGVGGESSVPAFASYILADLEMLIGVIMMGIGIGTLTRKIIR